MARGTSDAAAASRIGDDRRAEPWINSTTSQTNCDTTKKLQQDCRKLYMTQSKTSNSANGPDPEHVRETDAAAACCALMDPTMSRAGFKPGLGVPLELESRRSLKLSISRSLSLPALSVRRFHGEQ